MSKNIPSIVSLLPFRPFILLIDADNTEPDLVPQMMQKMEEWGIPTLRRIYGNQETLQNKRWKELCLCYAFQPIPHIGISGAKNATDIALTVDAMDLLRFHQESRPNFCLITGDQDFTALVLRMKSQGCDVYCIGKTTKAEALAKVSTVFLSAEYFSVPTVMTPPKEKQEPISKPRQKRLPATKKGTPSVTPPAKNTKKTKQHPSPPEPTLKEFLTTTVEMLCVKRKTEWITLSLLGSRIKVLHPQFQAKTYGYKNLPALIGSQTDLFEHRQQGNHLEVRVKKPTKKEGK